MTAAARVIRKTLLGYVAPAAMLLFLLLSNFLTRAPAVRRMIGLDDRPIVVTLEAAADSLFALEQPRHQGFAGTAACLEPHLSRGREALGDKRYGEAIGIWREKLGQGCQEAVLFANIAAAYIDSGALPMADSMVALALAADSALAEAYLIRADLAAQRQNHDMAEESYLRALSLKPHDAGAAFSLGVLYFRTKRYAAARDQFATALRIGSDKPRTWYNIGLSFHRRDMGDSALHAYREAIQRRPDYLAPRINMAALYQSADSLDQAEKAYGDIVSIDPSNTRARLELARLLIAREKYGAARRQLAAARTINPDNLDIRYEQAKILGLRGRDAEALRAYRDIVSSDPDNPRVFYNIGVNLMDMGKAAEAEESYLSALNRDPFFWKAAYNLGVYYLRKGRYADAIQYLRRVVEIHPEHLESAYNLGLAYMRSEQWTPALRQFENALSMDSTHLEALYNIGVLYLKREDNDTALTHFRRAAALDPRHEKSLYNMGLIYKRDNHCDSAIALFQRAIAVRGAYPEARFNSAVCYRSMGDIDKALEQIDAAIRADSAYVRGLTLKAELLRAAGRADSALATLHCAHALPGAGPGTARALAELYRERDNEAEALRFYHEYLDAESTDVAALHDAARLERVAGNAQRGLVYMRRAYELDRDDERLALDYGRALFEAKQLNEARRILTRALDQSPDNIDLRSQLAAIYEEQGNSRGAGRHYEALGRITGDYDHIIKAADQYLEASDYERALAQYAHARSLRPGEWRPSYYTSLVQTRLDKFDEARASWRMFADSFPDDSRGYYQLGKLAAEREDWDSAVGYLRQSLGLKSYRFTHFYLAQSLYELERYREALEHARAFLEADPDSRRGRKLLRAIRGKQKS